jgi:hypothetical protein
MRIKNQQRRKWRRLFLPEAWRMESSLRSSDYMIKGWKKRHVLSMLQDLDTALPYINGVLWILTAAAKASLNSIAPPAGSFIPDNIRPIPANCKVNQEHPMLAGTIRSSVNASCIFTNNTSQMYREWQKCF